MTSSPSVFVSRHQNWLFPLFLLAAAFIAYQPAWRGGFVWDEICVPHDPHDIGYYTLHGLGQIWFHTFREQYYPLTFTLCWLEYHLWGFNTLGFHLVNILFHVLDSILLWIVLRRLSAPGAGLAAAIFALHPVNVETVAWITETRNTLSGFFYLCSILAALRFWLPQETAIAGSQPAERLKDWKCFWLAFALFVCALLSKTTTIPLPAVVLLLVWWKRGKIIWRDVYPLLLFLAAGVALGLITHNAERGLSASGKDVELSLVDRCLIVGRNLWFYSGKLAWPHPLVFIYPRWKIDPSSLLDWLPLLALAPVATIAWLKRKSRWGRPVLVALGYYAGMLFLMLGFFNIAFFLYSFVADHFQYLACMGPIALFAAGITLAFNRLGKAKLILAPVLSVCLLAILGTLTWNQCRMYAGEETLWRTTLAQNPNAFVARTDLGTILLSQGKQEEAIQQYRSSLALHPNAEIYHNLGNALLQTGKPDEASVDFQKAIELDPEYAAACADLGNAYVQMGQIATGMQYIQKALQMQPDFPTAYYDLGNAYFQEGELDLAISYWQKAVELNPDLTSAQNNLASALLMEGQPARAIQHWKQALAVNPDLVNVQARLAWVLATCPQDSLRDGAAALVLAQRANGLSGGENPVFLRALAAAYAENGQFPNAVAAAQKAVAAADSQGDEGLASYIQSQLKRYQTGQPFRDTSFGPH